MFPVDAVQDVIDIEEVVQGHQDGKFVTCFYCFPELMNKIKIPTAEVHDVIVVEIAIHVPNRMIVIVIRGQSLVNGAETKMIQE